MIFSSFSSFSCHKCAHWSHPILTFLTFHEIDFATNVPSVLFNNRTIVGSCLLFADAILLQIWLYTHMPSLVWIVWKTNEILHIVQRVALGVCFSIFGGLRNIFYIFTWNKFIVFWVYINGGDTKYIICLLCDLPVVWFYLWQMLNHLHYRF